MKTRTAAISLIMLISVLGPFSAQSVTNDGGEEILDQSPVLYPEPMDVLPDLHAFSNRKNGPTDVMYASVNQSEKEGSVTFQTDRLIIEFNGKSSLAQGLDQLGKNPDIAVLDAFEFPFPGAVIENGRANLSFENVDSWRIHPDVEVSANLAESVSRIGADVVWNTTDRSNRFVNGQGITIAVIDTGVYYDHPDLGGGFGPGYKVKGGWDFVNNDPDPMDDNGHGTHCTGIAAANGNLKGVAPNVSVLAYKVLDENGRGYSSWVIKAIEKAVDPDGDPETDDGADIISLSLGAPGYLGDPVCRAVEEAVRRGVVVTAAAGNRGTTGYGSIESPGISPHVITVGAVDKNDNVPSFSSRGPTNYPQGKPDLAAPGVNVYSTVTPEGELGDPSLYNYVSGTSMSTPFVAGSAALLLQKDKGLSPYDVKNILLSNAEAVGDDPFLSGAGIVRVDSSAAQLFSINFTIQQGVAYSDNVDFTMASHLFDQNVELNVTLKRFQDHMHQALDEQHNCTATDYSLFVETNGTASAACLLPPKEEMPSGYYLLEIQARTEDSWFNRTSVLFALSIVDVRLTRGGESFYSGFSAIWIINNETFDSTTGLPEYGRTFFLPPGEHRVVVAGDMLMAYGNEPFLVRFEANLEAGTKYNFSKDVEDLASMDFTFKGAYDEPVFLERSIISFSEEMLGKEREFHATALLQAPLSDPRNFIKGSTIRFSQEVNNPTVVMGGVSFGSAHDFVSENFEDLKDGSLGYDGVSATHYGTTFYLIERELVDNQTANLKETPVHSLGHGTNLPYDDSWVKRATPQVGGGRAEFALGYDRSSPVYRQSPFLWKDLICNTPLSYRYFPGSLESGFVEVEIYQSDWGNATWESDSLEYPGTKKMSQKMDLGEVGSPPFGPGTWVRIVNGHLAVEHPLIVDGTGSKTALFDSSPYLKIYRDGNYWTGTGLSSYWSTPSPRKHFNGTTGNLTLLLTAQNAGANPSFIEMGARFNTSQGPPPMVTALEGNASFEPGSECLISWRSTTECSATLTWAQDGNNWSNANVSFDNGTFRAILVPQGTGPLSINITLDAGPDGTFHYNATDLVPTSVVSDLTIDMPVKSFYEYDNRGLPFSATVEGFSPDVTEKWMPLVLEKDGEKVGFLLDGLPAVHGMELSNTRECRFQLPDDFFNSSRKCDLTFGGTSSRYQLTATTLNFSLEERGVSVELDERFKTTDGTLDMQMEIMNGGPFFEEISFEHDLDSNYLTLESFSGPDEYSPMMPVSDGWKFRSRAPPEPGSSQEHRLDLYMDGSLFDTRKIDIRSAQFSTSLKLGKAFYRFPTSLEATEEGMFVGDYSGIVKFIPFDQSKEEKVLFDTSQYWVLGLDLADVNGDGYVDLLTGDWEGHVEIHYGDEEFDFDTTKRIADYGSIANAVFGDFTGDGEVDVAASNNAGGLRIYSRDFTGTFVTYATIDTQEDSGHFNNQGLCSWDVNGDGLDDILKGYFGNVHLFLNKGNGNFEKSSIYSFPRGSVQGIATGDVDGDGSDEIVLAYYNDLGQRSGSVVVLDEGANGFSPVEIPHQGRGVWSVELFDMDGDGDKEIFAGSDLGDVLYMNNLETSVDSPPLAEVLTRRMNYRGKVPLSVQIDANVSIKEVVMRGEGTHDDFTCSAELVRGSWTQGRWYAMTNANNSFDLTLEITDVRNRTHLFHEFIYVGKWIPAVKDNIPDLMYKGERGLKAEVRSLRPVGDAHFRLTDANGTYQVDAERVQGDAFNGTWKGRFYANSTFAWRLVLEDTEGRVFDHPYGDREVLVTEHPLEVLSATVGPGEDGDIVVKYAVNGLDPKGTIVLSGPEGNLVWSGNMSAIGQVFFAGPQGEYQLNLTIWDDTGRVVSVTRSNYVSFHNVTYEEGPDLGTKEPATETYIRV